MPESRLASRPLRAVRIDFAPQAPQPAVWRLVLATVLAVLGSLLADAVIVMIGKAVFPSTRAYVHYQFADYAKLTIIGVGIACVGWPIVTRLSSTPRWLYSRMAVLVTLVLLLPDAWLLRQGQPGRAVAVLIVMHLAIAVVTYLTVVTVGAPRPRD